MIRQAYKQVEMTGFIPSISPYSSHSIMIVPILTGSGMRMKIIEAANNGIPFVTTQVGVEGLTFENGKDCYIENTHSAFAQSTLALMNDPNTQLTFRTNAFKTDKLLKENLVGQVPQQGAMELELKAIIQQYMERMNGDRMTVE